MAGRKGAVKLEVSVASHRARSETAALQIYDLLHVAADSGHFADLGLPRVDPQVALAVQEAIPVLLKALGCHLPTGQNHNGAASTFTEKASFNTRVWNGVNLLLLQFQLVQLLAMLPVGGRMRQCRKYVASAFAKASGARKAARLLIHTTCAAGCDTQRKSLDDLKADLLSIAEECAAAYDQLGGFDSAVRQATIWVESTISKARKEAVRARTARADLCCASVVLHKRSGLACVCGQP